MLVTKQVALSEHAYARLRRAKHAGESFSQVVERLLDTQGKDPTAFGEALAKVKWTTTPQEQLRRIERARDDSREVA